MRSTEPRSESPPAHYRIASRSADSCCKPPWSVMHVARCVPMRRGARFVPRCTFVRRVVEKPVVAPSPVRNESQRAKRANRFGKARPDNRDKRADNRDRGQLLGGKARPDSCTGRATRSRRHAQRCLSVRDSERRMLRLRRRAHALLRYTAEGRFRPKGRRTKRPAAAADATTTVAAAAAATTVAAAACQQGDLVPPGLLGSTSTYSYGLLYAHSRSGTNVDASQCHCR